MPRLPHQRDERVDTPEKVESNVQGNETTTSGPETEQPDSIARRAYERFHERGGEHGHDQEDWFEAERELNRNEPK